MDISSTFKISPSSTNILLAPSGWHLVSAIRDMVGVRWSYGLTLLSHCLHTSSFSADRHEGSQDRAWFNILSEHVAYVRLALMQAIYGDFVMWRLPDSLFASIDNLDPTAVSRVFGNRLDFDDCRRLIRIHHSLSF